LETAQRQIGRRRASAISSAKDSDCLYGHRLSSRAALSKRLERFDRF
jgi:hypothetical protein